MLNGCLYFLDLYILKWDYGCNKIIGVRDDEIWIKVDLHALTNEISGTGLNDFNEFIAHGNEGNIVHGENGLNDLD